MKEKFIKVSIFGPSEDGVSIAVFGEYDVGYWASEDDWFITSDSRQSLIDAHFE